MSTARGAQGWSTAPQSLPTAPRCSDHSHTSSGSRLTPERLIPTETGFRREKSAHWWPGRAILVVTGAKWTAKWQPQEGRPAGGSRRAWTGSRGRVQTSSLPARLPLRPAWGMVWPQGCKVHPRPHADTPGLGCLPSKEESPEHVTREGSGEQFLLGGENRECRFQSPVVVNPQQCVHSPGRVAATPEWGRRSRPGAVSSDTVPKWTSKASGRGC